MRGGKRNNAGRKANSGAYGEPTVSLRIPNSLEKSIREVLEQYKDYVMSQSDDHTKKADNFFSKALKPLLSKLELPLFSSVVQAGFPSPADDNIEGKLDLNDHLISHPSATFFLRVSGDSMIYAGIQSGDLLVVDRSLSPRHNQIVIAVLQGELTVKRLYRKDNTIKLLPDNPSYPVIEIPRHDDLHIWGVVTSVVHKFM